MHLTNSNVFGATYCPSQYPYTNIYSIKTFVEQKHQKTRNNLKIDIINHSKTSFCTLSNYLGTANKEPDNRNDCLLAVNRIGGSINNLNESNKNYSEVQFKVL